MYPATAKVTVNSVLQYFDGYLRLARMRNDYRTVQHFEDCWTLVFTSFFGSYRETVAVARGGYQGPADVEPATRPPWFTAKYSRPVRKVIGQISERVAGYGRAECFAVTFDVLECGHRLDAVNSLSGLPPAKHRRCGECVKPVEETCKKTLMPLPHSAA